MATKCCSSCLRALRHQPQPLLRKPVNPIRAFHTTRTLLTVIQKPNAIPTTSIRHVTPQRAEGGPKVKDKTPILETAAAGLRRVTGSLTDTYSIYGITERMFKECAAQADYTRPQSLDSNAEKPKVADGEDLGVGDGWWHTEMDLSPTFSTWSQVTMLHMYLLVARFRCLPREQVGTWHQHLLDHFFYAAEDKMVVNHDMHARGTRNKYLKDLFVQWRGLLASYDEGLVKGDMVLAAAIWRNVFKADEEVDMRKLAVIAGFMRRTLHGLESLSNDDLQFSGIVLGDHGPDAALAGKRSKMMDLPFQNGPVKNMGQ